MFRDRSDPSRPARLSLPTRFVRFGLIGGSGVLVDLCFYKIFLMLQFPNPIARALSIGIAMSSNFLGNRHWTFPDARASSLWGQYWRYLLSSFQGALVSWSTSVLLSRFVSPFQRHLMVAALVGIAAGATANFVLSSRWVFPSRRC